MTEFRTSCSHMLFDINLLCLFRGSHDPIQDSVPAYWMSDTCWYPEVGSCCTREGYIWPNPKKCMRCFTSSSIIFGNYKLPMFGTNRLSGIKYLCWFWCEPLQALPPDWIEYFVPHSLLMEPGDCHWGNGLGYVILQSPRHYRGYGPLIRFPNPIPSNSRNHKLSITFSIHFSMPPYVYHVCFPVTVCILTHRALLHCITASKLWNGRTIRFVCVEI